MQYELFRNSIAAALADDYPDDISHILQVIDQIAVKFDIRQACTDLSIPEDDVPQLVKMHIAAMAVENRSRRTLDDRLRVLSVFFRTVRKPCEQITTNDIRAYLYDYKQQRGVKDSSLDHIRCIIRIFFTWLVDEEYLTRNPAAKIGVIKAQDPQRTVMTPMDLERFRAACVTIREKAIVDFLYSTAARVSEFCDTRISDVDLESQTVIIRHGKGDKTRKTYLNAESIVSLRRYLDIRQDKCPFLFVSERNPAHQLTPDTVQRILRAIGERAGLSIRVTPHVFRRTAATFTLRAGMPLDQVRRFLGHAKVDTTLMYAQTSDDDVRASHARYSA